MPLYKILLGIPTFFSIFILPEFELMNIICCSLPNFGNEIRCQVDVRVPQSKTLAIREASESCSMLALMEQGSEVFFVCGVKGSGNEIQSQQGSSFSERGVVE
jgi:hypothetical protein